jgi:hypothetical protein
VQSISLRTLISAIGLLVSAMTAVSLPVGYFVIGYSKTANLLDLTSDIDARRVANYIHSHDAKWLWQYQPGRLSDLLKPSDVEADLHKPRCERRRRARVARRRSASIARDGPQQLPSWSPAPRLVRRARTSFSGSWAKLPCSRS